MECQPIERVKYERYCPINTGDILGAKFKVLRRLGRGAFCSVWKVADMEGKKFAAKIYREGSYYREYFDNELEKLQVFKENEFAEGSKHIVGLVDYFAHIQFKNGRSSVHPVIITTLMGESMGKLIEKLRSGLPIDTVRNISAEILKGLDFIHGLGVIHADLNISNVLLTKPIKKIEQNEDISVVISDFNSSSTINKIFDIHVGTREYVSPELIMEMEFDQETDIWSFGCIVYELLTGNYLFDFDSNDSDSDSDSDSGSEYSLNSAEDDRESFDESSGSENSSSSTDFDWDSNYQHLVMIQQILGGAPKKMVTGGRQYFNNRGKLKHNPNVDMISMSKLLYENYEFTEAEANEISDFLLAALKYDPADRPTARELLKHPFVAGAKK